MYKTLHHNFLKFLGMLSFKGQVCQWILSWETDQSRRWCAEVRIIYHAVELFLWPYLISESQHILELIIMFQVLAFSSYGLCLSLYKIVRMAHSLLWDWNCLWNRHRRNRDGNVEEFMGQPSYQGNITLNPPIKELYIIYPFLSNKSNHLSFVKMGMLHH